MKGLEGILINPVMAFKCDFGVHKSLLLIGVLVI
jgi:hypothetical protein